MAEIVLNNCQECGSEPVKEEYKHFGEGVFIECSNEECGEIVFGRDEKEAIETWNKLTAVYGGAGFVCDSIARCAGWKKSMAQINLFQEFLASINQRAEYTGSKFKFCPWCGKEIKWEI